MGQLWSMELLPVAAEAVTQQQQPYCLVALVVQGKMISVDQVAEVAGMDCKNCELLHRSQHHRIFGGFWKANASEVRLPMKPDKGTSEEYRVLVS